FTLLDESYNANPVSVRAAIAVLGTAPKGPEGRRIAVLGDMLELGPEGAALHAGLAEPLDKAGIDLVFCSGPLMDNLWKVLPPHRRGAWTATSAELEPLVMRALRAGDVAMVKGSRGSLMAPVVEALKRRFPPVPADEHQGVA
ncbi:MAG: glutamate ligase domain-containing protein, partial [Phreatobacter sp.]